MDRPHRRRERPARRASAVAGQRLVVPHLHRDHRDPRHVAAMAHRSRAIRPSPPGTARQRTASAKPGLLHVPPQVRGVRAARRYGRLRRRTVSADAARSLCGQPRLAACRRRVTDDRTGRCASVSRPFVGRHRLHHIAGSTERDHRKLVAHVRADHHPVRSAVTRRNAGRRATAYSAESNAGPWCVQASHRDQRASSHSATSSSAPCRRISRY